MNVTITISKTLLALVLMLLSACAQGNQQDVQTHRQDSAIAVSPVRAILVETLADNIDAGTGGLAIDSKGNVLTADFGWRLDGGGKGGDKVFKVDAAGNVELFCDQMRGASGNAFDSEGNLFQSSIGGSFVSKVNLQGEVTVFCRTGLKSPVGIAIDAEDNLFVCNCGSASIQKITPDGTSTLFCNDKLLNCPNGITLAADGNFYVANFSNGDVIKIDSQGKASKLTTLPGNNNGHLTYHKGALYVIARTANQVYRVTLDGKTSLFVGSGERGKEDGKPLKALLSLPNDIGFSPDGKYMYVNETSPVSGDPRILGPTRIRRIEVRDMSEKKNVLDESETAVPLSNVSLESTSTPPTATIDEVDWISGHWQGEALGGKFEETWNPPLGGAMMGMFKLVKDDKISFYELLTIVPKDDSLVLRLKHFSNELVGWEEKDKSVEFPLVSINKNEARFDGLTFEKISDDQLNIVVVVNQESGEPQKINFECYRVGK